MPTGKGQRGKETLLSTADVAAVAGLSPNSIQSYYHAGYMPQPDVTIGVERARMHGWRRETIDEWLANRPGRGRRPKAED
ncbi:transcriptional regulator [Nanchangia anserum]|uniref:Transcriptional regulator n=1 Tax=Nanchangia anserum TaxID=2692125 RepID=A0A8I0KRX6_9ACTO|nr:transcriptional regulator [Nanchangia anserum]MBD3689842.1 transcriptional regulator [Nanchangia anserum]QOX82008.1 transcriptional regulator [Nanchangia anserum]